MATASVKGSTNMITLKYSGAAVSAVITLFGVLLTLSELFGLWTDQLGSIWVISGYVGIVMTAITTALFSVLSFLLYRSVTKDVAARTEYVTTSAYSFITNAFFAVLVGVFIVVLANLASILVSSLLLIGTTTDIASLYLGGFVPELLVAMLVAFVGFCAYKIMKGKNLSMLMTVVLMSLAGVVLLGVLITVPIKAHMTPRATQLPASSSTPSNQYDTNNFNDLFDQLYNSNR